MLAAVLDSTLRLLHPLMPFVTEALWQNLGEAAPRRGIDRELPGSELLVHATWPEARPDWRNEEAERSVALGREITSTIREMRARHQVAATEKIEVVLVPSRERSDLEPALELIAHLTNAAHIELAASTPTASDAATAVVEGVEIFVPGIVDVESEKKKLQTQRDKLAGRITGTRKKLDNQGFVAKAPPEVVERERESLVTLEAQLKSIEASLGALGE